MIGLYHGLRGGSFDSIYSYGYGYGYGLLASARFNGYYGPTDEGHSVGFRVSEVPEPGMVALLAFGGIGVLFQRRVPGR